MDSSYITDIQQNERSLFFSKIESDVFFAFYRIIGDSYNMNFRSIGGYRTPYNTAISKPDYDFTNKGYSGLE
ncbi:hypothetical protein CLI75_10265 [Porphyromonas gingivalis]|nr:hypothetical protein CS387_01335 [Porphyromonas gingivalis]PDP55293.1 hypothetical protein CLI75_10265 [Porphyromonas gingivalis]